MKKDKPKDYRMDKPMDYLHRRLFLYNGPLLHKFFGFPGEYIGPCPNKNPDGGRSMLEVDVAYLVSLGNGEKLIINVEDETSYVNANTLRKIDRYRVNFRYAFDLPVLSIITTSLPSEKCLKELIVSSSDIFRPLLFSYLDFDGEKNLNNLRYKIKHNKLLTKIEFLLLILIIRTFDHNHSELLEEICLLIKDAKTEDLRFKMEMVYCSRYIIHKYAETVDDIKRLEKVVGLEKTVTCGELIDSIKNDSREEGRVEGMEEGIEVGIEKGIIKGGEEATLSILNSLVNDSRCGFTVEELSDKFGVTVNQILAGK